MSFTSVLVHVWCLYCSKLIVSKQIEADVSINYAPISINRLRKGSKLNGQIVLAINQTHALRIKNLRTYSELFGSDFSVTLVSDKNNTLEHIPQVLIGWVCIDENQTISHCNPDHVVISVSYPAINGAVLFESNLYNFSYSYAEPTIAKIYKHKNSFQSKMDYILHAKNENLERDPNIPPLDFEYPDIYPLYDGQDVELYIETVIVNDVFRLEHFQNNINALIENTILIAATANIFFASRQFPKANLRLVVTGIVVLKIDPFNIDEANPDARVIIDSANSWRNSLLRSLPKHDVMHVFSGLEFIDNVLGLAYLNSACDIEMACEQLSSGYCYYDSRTNDFTECCIRWAAAVSMVRDVNDARTIAHEIGHQLGFEHDQNDASRGCSSIGGVMAASSIKGANWLDDKWSQCTLDQFEETLTSRHEVFDIYNYHSYGCLLNPVDQSSNFSNKLDINMTNIGDGSGSQAQNLSWLSLLIFIGFIALNARY